VWTAETIDEHTAWHYPLSADSWHSLEEFLQNHPQPTTDARVSDDLRAACAKDIEPALNALESGRGFVIMDGLPVERCSTQESQVMYWLVGQMLGCPIEQNVQGTLLYDVRDTGQDVAQGARFSVTNRESSFHTDNSFGDVTDYIGLLCLQTAKAGGVNQVVSGYTVVNELAEKYPDVLEILSQPFHVDRRGGVKEGESPTVQVPIIEGAGNELIFRYLRYWIEVGHEKVGEPLTSEQVRALDVLDETVQRRDLIVEFSLQRGQMLFINNRWILHNRTAFEDYPELERRRHYVRLWLKAKSVAPRK
jgi:hypothetical protein